MPKRRRAKTTPTVDESHVLISCYDSPNELMELKISLLEDIKPLLLSRIRYEQPIVGEDGRRFWRADAPHDVFCAFVETLRTRRVVAYGGATLSNLLAFLDFQGVKMCSSAGPVLLEPPRRGLSHICKADRREKLQETAETVASALALWPRLEVEMSARASALSSGASTLAVTPTRALVALIEPPSGLCERTSGVEVLARRWPRCIAEIIASIGVRRHALIEAGVLGHDLDQKNFISLSRDIEGESLGCFALTRYDVPREHANASELNSAWISRTPP